LKPQLFVDLDGVLADFDNHYRKLFHAEPDQNGNPPEMWDNIRSHKDFYPTMPLMPNAREFWSELKRFHPTPVVLTGIRWSIPNVAEDKRRWVANHIDAHATVICCRSMDKFKHGKRGDILIDDRLKYSKYWIQMGGIFVLHTSIMDTLGRLNTLFSAINAPR
jgi:5'(3')-deoxyribonucleotidase